MGDDAETAATAEWPDDEMALTAPEQMPTQDMAELQALADQAAVLRIQRPSTAANIFIGVGAIAAGIAAFGPQLFGITMVGFGAVLLSTGIAVRALSSPAGFLVDGIACTFVAVFFVVVSLGLAAAGKGTPLVAVAAVVPAVWAVNGFRRYARYRHVPRLPLSAEVRLQLDTAHKELLMARAATDPLVIELVTLGCPARGRLHRGMAVFVKGQDLFFLTPAEVTVDARETEPGQLLKMDCEVAGRQGEGWIRPESWERYSRWRAAHGLPAGSAAA